MRAKVRVLLSTFLPLLRFQSSSVSFGMLYLASGLNEMAMTARCIGATCRKIRIGRLVIVMGGRAPSLTLNGHLRTYACGRLGHSNGPP